MLDQETISLIQSFGYGFAQNLISSAVVEWKKLKDDRAAQENAAWLESVERSKPLEDRIVGAVCEALRNLKLTKEQFHLLLPLASDPILGGELARQILADKYSPEDVRDIILKCPSSTEAFRREATQLASLVVTAVQSVIADDPHLHRTKELHFQTNISAQVAEVKAETEKTQEVVRESTQTVIESFDQRFQAFLTAQKTLSDKTSEPEVREKIYHDRIEQARKLLEAGKPKTARRLLEELRVEVAEHNPSKQLLFRIATNMGACAIQLDDKQAAIKEIDLAFQFDPENPKAITNLSATTLLKGQPEEALGLAKRARQMLPQDSVATANYIQALFALGREAELVELIGLEAWMTKDANCCFAIGTLYFNRGRFSDGESFAARYRGGPL